MSNEAAAVSGGESTGSEATASTSSEALETSDSSGEPNESEGQESSEQTQSAPDHGKLYEVKINGTSVKVTLDEMMKGFQLGSAAHQRFQEAANAKKQAEQLLGKLKQNPIEAALEAGVSEDTFREMVEQYLYGKIKYDEMTPEQRELAELKKYKEGMEKTQKEREELEKTSKHEQEVLHYQNQYIESYEKAFAEAGVAKSEGAIQRVAQIQLDALEAGWDMPVDMAIHQYNTEQQTSVSSFISSLSEDQLEQVIGKDKMKALRKKEISNLKNPVSNKATPKSASASVPKDKISMQKFFDTLK
jgi:hypothetical protein